MLKGILDGKSYLAVAQVTHCCVWETVQSCWEKRLLAEHKHNDRRMRRRPGLHAPNAQVLIAERTFPAGVPCRRAGTLGRAMSIRGSADRL
jgi:hypothetical protein